MIHDDGDVHCTNLVSTSCCSSVAFPTAGDVLQVAPLDKSRDKDGGEGDPEPPAWMVPVSRRCPRSPVRFPVPSTDGRSSASIQWLSSASSSLSASNLRYFRQSAPPWSETSSPACGDLDFFFDDNVVAANNLYDYKLSKRHLKLNKLMHIKFQKQLYLCYN